MEVEEVQHLEKEHSPEYIFSLKPHNINRPTFEADFSPLRCKYTPTDIEKLKKLSGLFPLIPKNMKFPLPHSWTGPNLGNLNLIRS